MEQLTAQLKQATDNMNEYRETPYYLMIDQMSGKGQVTVKYWTTHCETGNQIQAGVELSPYATTYLDSKTLALVSTTYGGKQAPKNRELIDIYKYGIISHGRVLTQNDIASFCKKELGELLLRTEIRNGVEISGAHRRADTHQRSASGPGNEAGRAVAGKTDERQPAHQTVRLLAGHIQLPHIHRIQ